MNTREQRTTFGLKPYEGFVYVESINVGELIERLTEVPNDTLVLLEMDGKLVNIGFDRVATVTTDHSGEKQKAAILHIINQEYLDRTKGKIPKEG